jgi:hypothetical protein
MNKITRPYSRLLQLDTLIKPEGFSRYRQIIVVLCVVLLLPVLGAGFKSGDLALRTTAIGSEALYAKGLVDAQPDKGKVQAITGLFVSLDPDVQGQIEQQRAYGTLPWWTYERIKVRLFRPVTALFHHLDYLLWPGSPTMMLLQNLLWFAALVAMAGVLFRRVMGATTVTLTATLIFGLDCSLMASVGWIAGRSLLLAGVFGLVSLQAHVAWRQTRAWPHLLLSVGALALSLYSSEAGVATLLWLIAYSVTLEEKPFWRRFVSISPALGMVAVWSLFYLLFGYGVSDAPLFVDPLRAPSAWLLSLVEHVPGLLWSQFFGIDLAISHFSPLLARLAWMVFLVMLVCMLPLLMPVIRGSKVAKFWVTGALLSLLPLGCVVLPDARLLLFVSLGASGLIALTLVRLSERLLAHRKALGDSHPSALKQRLKPLNLLGIRVGRALLIALHLILPLGVKLIWVGVFLAGLPFSLDSHDVRLEQFMNDPRVPKQEYILVNPPQPALVGEAPYALEQLARESGVSAETLLPAAIRMLAVGTHSMTLERIDRYTLRIVPVGGYLPDPEGWVADEAGQLSWYHPAYAFRKLSHRYRQPDQRPLLEGRRVQLPGLEIIVEAVNEQGRPSSVLFQFERPLEDQRYRWFVWDWSRAQRGDEGLFGFDPFDLPMPGESVVINGPFDR